MFLPPILVAFLYYKPHTLHTLAMFRTGGDNINSGRVDAAVTENIGKLGNVLFNPVKYTGEQVAQVMWEHLSRVYICFFT